MELEKLTSGWFYEKRVTVMGLGLHGGGLGTTIWMMRHGAKVTVTDLRDQGVLAPSLAEVEKAFITAQRELGKDKVFRIRYVLGKHEESDFSDSDLVMQNPGVPRESSFLEVARKHGVRIENEASVFFQLCPFPIIGITGTRGKTTTTMLLGAIAKIHNRASVVAGNLRISMLGLLDGLLEKKDNKKTPLVILELSSWQLELLAQHNMSPHIGVVTNVFPDHLNRYRDMDDYAAAKENLVRFQNEGDVAVLNYENEWTRKMGESDLHSKVMWFGLSLSENISDAITVKKDNVVVRRGGVEEVIMPVSEIRLRGEHNFMNVLAVVGAAVSAGVSLKDINEGVAGFVGVPNRQELVATINGVEWINDTTATSPDASMVALKTFGDDVGEKRVVLITGGADKKLEFEPWARMVEKYVKAVILFDGTATPRMEEALQKVGCKAPLLGARNMDEAISIASEHVQDGDVVLLSPGCASFGLFLHEFDRGEQFVRGVKKIARKSS